MAFDSAQYKRVFDLHYEELYGYACSILRSEVYVEDIVQNIFIRLWQTRDTVRMGSVRAYLYTAVRNECFNHLKHKNVRVAHAQSVLAAGEGTTHHFRAEEKELQNKIQELVSRLPEKCAMVFYMCRQLGLSYKEVAEKLEISVKTVENQMTKALKFLRSGLAGYLVSLILLIIYPLFNL
ncbi:RNA polymerase sigma-70 factor [Niabella beijingensis]|uniref:RNA polymerase sigma-70 factor n=1 Tax=Niabella beijingensis TaxID=2872700 RepID=UPI001CBF67D2|nr:RNA polymerase sigma-70 factor [Niabella beijingensis]MBZ4190930.1 RNA polymerase sigma-70 factor [Niabella beijingensis]